jgi:hypothetical protein
MGRRHGRWLCDLRGALTCRVSVLGVQTALLFFLLFKYGSLLSEMPRQYSNVGFHSVNFDRLEARGGVQLIFNTHIGDAALSEAQCTRHPNAVFCSNQKLPDVPCRQIVTNYPYGKLSYKKWQCISVVHQMEPDVAIVLADIDTILSCEQPVNVTDHVLCLRVTRPLTQDKNDVYYSFNGISFYQICLGAYIFIPNKVVSNSLDELVQFEHHGADDFAFTFFFEHKLGVRTENLAHADVSGERDCSRLQMRGVLAMQCESQNIKEQGVCSNM